MFSFNKHAIEFNFFILLGVILILSIILCVWNIFKLRWMCEDRQNDQQSQNEEEREMENLNQIQNYENALQENVPTDTQEV